MKRKDFIAASLLTTAGLSLKHSAIGSHLHGIGNEFSGEETIGENNEVQMKICIFSKQLQWLNYQDMADAVAEMGYDGIDLTVRANGHVLPERVETDLPKAVDAAKKAGIKIMMISTDINDHKEPKTEKILKTAAALNIRFYRTNGLNYPKNLEIPATLDSIKNKYAGLSALNKKYGLHSDYLNHSGEGFGSSLWDLWLTIKDLDPKYIGSQFDIKHATIDGPYSWPTSLKLIHKYVQTMVIRDFTWEQKEGTWEIRSVPIGEGMVDFKKYFGLVKQYNISGPISVMCDYGLGGAENGANTLTIPGKHVLDAMKKDLLTLKSYLQDAEL